MRKSGEIQMRTSGGSATRMRGGFEANIQVPAAGGAKPAASPLTTENKMSTHECLRILVKIDGKESRPTNRDELEAALGSKAVADCDLIPRDEDWLSEDCCCAINPGATAHSAGINCDPNYPDQQTDLYFFK